MSKLVARKKGVKRTVSIGKVAPETAEQVEDLDGRIEASARRCEAASAIAPVPSTPPRSVNEHEDT